MSTKIEVPKTQIIKDLEALAQHPRTPKRVGKVALGAARGLHAVRRPSYGLRVRSEKLAERSKAWEETSAQKLDLQLAAFELQTVLSDRLKSVRRGDGSDTEDLVALEAVWGMQRKDPDGFKKLAVDYLAYRQHLAEDLMESGVKERKAYEEVNAIRQTGLSEFLTSAESWAQEQVQPTEVVAPE